MRIGRVAALAAGLLMASGSATAVWGTTLVPMSDADLVRTSAAIVVGTVRRIQSVERRHGGIVTEVTLRVERQVKGRLRSAKVVVTAPGGRVGAKTVVVLGAPEFARGERVLVFLKRGAEGRLRTNALALGKYRVREAGGRVLAERVAPTRDVRPLDGFLTSLDGLSAGAPEEAIGTGRVVMPAAEVAARVEVDSFTFLASQPYRFFEDPVVFRVANSDTGLGPVASQSAVVNALAAWTNVTTSSLVLQTGAATAPARSVAGGVCDGVSAIQFEDPFHEVQDMTNCSGVLAVGGFCSSGGTMVINGTTYYRIVEGDLTLNERMGTCWGATNTTEVLTHEIGHAIGLGHSADSTATMYSWAHFDGRGGAVGTDDAAGVSALYPVVTSGTPTTSSTSTSSTSSSSTSSSTTSTSRTTSSTSSTSTSRTTSSTSSTSTSRTTSSTSSTSSSRTTSSSVSTSTTSSTSATSSSRTTSSTSSTSTSRTTSTSSSTSTSRTTSSSSSTSTTSSSTSTSSTSSTEPLPTSTTSTLPPTTSTTLPRRSTDTDADGDGVDDLADACPETPEGELVDPHGCSVCPCTTMPDGSSWTSRNAYTRCIRRESRRLYVEGRLSRGAAHDAIKRGLTSTCARPSATRCCLFRDDRHRRAACRILGATECAALGVRTGLVLDAGEGSCVPNPCQQVGGF